MFVYHKYDYDKMADIVFKFSKLHYECESCHMTIPRKYRKQHQNVHEDFENARKTDAKLCQSFRIGIAELECVMCLYPVKNIHGMREHIEFHEHCPKCQYVVRDKLWHYSYSQMYRCRVCDVLEFDMTCLCNAFSHGDWSHVSGEQSSCGYCHTQVSYELESDIIYNQDKICIPHGCSIRYMLWHRYKATRWVVCSCGIPIIPVYCFAHHPTFAREKYNEHVRTHVNVNGFHIITEKYLNVVECEHFQCDRCEFCKCRDEIDKVKEHAFIHEHEYNWMMYTVYGKDVWICRDCDGEVKIECKDEHATYKLDHYEHQLYECMLDHHERHTSRDARCVFIRGVYDKDNNDCPLTYVSKDIAKQILELTLEKNGVCKTSLQF